MILASWAPFAAASDGDSGEHPPTQSGIFYTLEEFDPMVNGKPYLFAGGEDEIIFSATRHLKQQWIDDGYPDLMLPFEETSTSGRTAGRACENAWSAGQTGTVQTTDVAVVGGAFCQRKTGVGKQGVCAGRCPGHNLRGWSWIYTNGRIQRNRTINQV